jgi:DNA-binding CsgD family transcriptional regulator
MSIVYVTLINIILLFIIYLVLNHKINKNSTSALLDKYAREVENLIVELNRTLDDVLNLSEERVNELKRLIRKAEKALAFEGAAPEGAGAPAPFVRAHATAAEGKGKKTEAKSARRNTEGAAGDAGRSRGEDSAGRVLGSAESARPVSVPAESVPLYDMRGKKVDILPAVEEEHRESPRPSNIFERTRHLLSMGHSKDEIARMLNLSRAEMEFLASLHNK